MAVAPASYGRVSVRRARAAVPVHRQYTDGFASPQVFHWFQQAPRQKRSVPQMAGKLPAHLRALSHPHVPQNLPSSHLWWRHCFSGAFQLTPVIRGGA